MASDQFYLFAALASFNKEIQEKLRHVQTPEAILAIASEHGYQISLQELIYYSVRLNADHWIWVDKGEAWRESFFARERQLDLQAV
jgi:predicted ribosomally synthesized peptide with nif11-like leader